MFNVPTGCDRASCRMYVQWAPRGSDTIEFELEGRAEGWVAVGVSADQVMGGNGIDDVFVCQRDGLTDTVYAQDTYNPETQSPRGNTRDTVSTACLRTSVHDSNQLEHGIYFTEPNWIPEDILIL